MSKKTLVAIELDNFSANVVLSRVAAVRQEDDTVDVVHVVDPSGITYTADPTMTGKMYKQSYENALEKARIRLEELCKPHGITPENCHIRYGRISREIHELLYEKKYDELVIGSHGWSGWQRVLGSKAASIIHGATVDTWVLKIGVKPS